MGRQIWRGALLLGDFVLQHGPSFLQDRTVLELGSGVGLTSIVAAMFATEVICTGDNNFLMFLYTASWYHRHVSFFSVNICLPGILKFTHFNLLPHHFNSLYLMLVAKFI